MLTSFVNSAGKGGISRFSADSDDIIIGDSDTTFHDDANKNIAIGGNALDATSGDADSNIAVGTSALTALTSGSFNVGIGESSLAAIDTEIGNVAIGREVLAQATGANYSVGVGYYAMAGAATTGAANVAIGREALMNVSSGDNNVAIGSYAGDGITGATGVVAIGASALSAAHTRNGTVMIGQNAGALLTTGDHNIGIGYGALGVHVDGARNIAMGYGAMGDTNAGSTVDGSSDNTFIGQGAGGGTWNNAAVSDKNVGIGNYTLNDALNGAINNVAMGYDALGRLTEGKNNTCIGSYAGDGITTGEQNTGIGSGVAFDVDANNQTCVGYGATTDSANDIAIGNTSVDEIEGQVSFGTYSDKRIKRDIKDSDLGLDFIKLLKPRKFKKVNPAKYPKSIKNKNDGLGEWTDDQANKVWDGLIAQEVKKALDSCNTSFSGWREKKNSKQVLEYESLVVPLIKAVQELSSQVESLKEQLNNK